METLRFSSVILDAYLAKNTISEPGVQLLRAVNEFFDDDEIFDIMFMAYTRGVLARMEVYGVTEPARETAKQEVIAFVQSQFEETVAAIIIAGLSD